MTRFQNYWAERKKPDTKKTYIGFLLYDLLEKKEANLE